MKYKLLFCSLSTIAIIGCGGQTSGNKTYESKINTSEQLSAVEQSSVNNLVGAEGKFYTYRGYYGRVDNISMDFSSCWNDDSKGLIKNCDYEVTIKTNSYNSKTCPVEAINGECPIKQKTVHYKVGFKDQDIYIYYPDGVKKYKIESGDSNDLYTLKNESDSCSSIIDGDISRANENYTFLEPNNKHCSFVEQSIVDDIKTVDSQPFSDEERTLFNGLMENYELAFNVYQIRDIDSSGYYTDLDFASCYGEPGGSGEEEACQYEMKSGNFSYHVGYRNDIVYIYYPSGTKEYKLKYGGKESLYTLENKADKCLSTLTIWDYGLDDDKNPCKLIR